MLSLWLCSLSVLAQQKGGDFIESTSYKKSDEGVRSQQYFPEGQAFVCTNGKNRYTRALYGSHTDWRLETRDVPIFAVAKKSCHRNIRFVVETGDASIPLESARYCKAAYANGKRAYWLVDSRWGNDTLTIEVIAMPDSEAAVWKIDARAIRQPLCIKAIVSPIAIPKLNRNGDLGADPAGCFEPTEEVLQSIEVSPIADSPIYIKVNVNVVSAMDTKVGQQVFGEAEAYYRQLTHRIVFDTPDPYINTLGSALVLAADGDWDGKTWLHGCVGWRMPLAGWRAAYVGDVLGWNDRAVSHFDAYAKSQVTDVAPIYPHPSQDPQQNLARAEKKWGTQMYSNGYICRNPERNDQMHHYDMNLNYIDELLWHFQYDADTAYMRKLWPVIKSHLAWEKRNYDPDGDHLYDAYCCIWASDALYYNGGAVTHSSAYNYRGNLLAARIAELIGENPKPYRDEAEAILRAMNERLWMSDKGVWAEYQDAMGLKRLHEHPAVWSIYTPIDCGACTPEQAFAATRYVDEHIPHIDVGKTGFQTIATSDWLPYSWSINNVAAAEVMHTALAFFEAGKADEGYRLMKANILDQMYDGQSPANFGQISQYDAARGECYRDFGDCIGISSRTLIQGLFGVVPDALNGRCVIRPGFPSKWKHALLRTPYIEYVYSQKDGKDVYEVTQHFAQPLQIVIRQNVGNGRYVNIIGTSDAHQVIEVTAVAQKKDIPSESSMRDDAKPTIAALGLEEPVGGRCRKQDLSHFFNAKVDDIFKNKYLSPRPQTTTLQIPTQGIGEWCHPQLTAEINDSVFRSLAKGNEFMVAGIPFRTPQQGRNIIYTSLWDNYPDAVTVPLKGQASSAYLLMAGSTNHMQSRIDNGHVIVTYQDETTDTLRLRNPDNWCPIEQDYFIDGKAFTIDYPRPYRICLGTGQVSRYLGDELQLKEVYGRRIPGGAAQMLRMPLNPQKKLRSLTLRTLSNDVVIGIMAISLQ